MWSEKWNLDHGGGIMKNGLVRASNLTEKVWIMNNKKWTESNDDWGTLR